MVLNVLGSSSLGNGYILQNDTEALIIEAGVKMEEAKKALHWNTAKVRGCVMSHEHGDHSKYAKEYEKAGIRLLALPEVIERRRLGRLAAPIVTGKGYVLGGFRVLPFPVMHDVPCVGFLITHEETGRICFFTDTYAFAREEIQGDGVPKLIPYRFPNVAHWLVEANYDDRILNRNIENGNIPPSFKNRLQLSHMSITNAVRTMKRQDLSAAKDILLIHLSDGNSDERRFVERMRKATGKRVVVARPGLQIDFNINPI